MERVKRRADFGNGIYRILEPRFNSVLALCLRAHIRQYDEDHREQGAAAEEEEIALCRKKSLNKGFSCGINEDERNVQKNGERER